MVIQTIIQGIAVRCRSVLRKFSNPSPQTNNARGKLHLERDRERDRNRWWYVTSSERVESIQKKVTDYESNREKIQARS